MRPWFIFGAACFVMGFAFAVLAYGLGQRTPATVGFAVFLGAVSVWCAGEGRRRLAAERDPAPQRGQQGLRHDDLLPADPARQAVLNQPE